MENWLNAIAVPALVVDGRLPGQPIQLANRAWRRIHSPSADLRTEGEPLLLSGFYRTTPNDRLITTINEVLSNPLGYRTITVESQHSDKERSRWYRHSLSCIDSASNNPDGSLLLILEQDITWEVLDESRQAQRAAVDPLTGLLSREPFLKELKKNLSELSITKGAICLVFIDLNKFKPINDDYGHDAGDQVLSQIGERLLAEMSHGNLAGRLGGDEFVLMLTGTFHHEAISEYLKGLAERVFQPVRVSADLTIPIGGSFGFACTQDADASVAELLKAADLAMYRAKENLNTSFVVAGEVIESFEKRQRRAEFVQALKTDVLELYLQPVISLKHDLVIGFEVLPRWQHPEYGLLELEHFHPLLIHSEEGKAFDRWLILTAAKLSANFQNQGFDIGIGINLTRRQLDEGSFVDFMREAKPFFADGRVDLTLEIIESPHFRDEAMAFSALQQAREMGSQVVLDHFGSGISSMVFASRVPLDFIKLHDDLCHDLRNNQERKRYAGALIAFSHELGVPVVASGIGNEDDAELLRAMKCDLIQGNLWWKPMSLQEIQNQFLRKNQHDHYVLRRKA